VAENRQIGSVFTRFWNSRSKKHRKYQCVGWIGSPKPRYLRCFLPLVAKSTVFTVVFGQHLAKTLVFTDVSPYNKKKNKNTVNYNVLSLLLGCVGGVEGRGGGGY